MLQCLITVAPIANEDLFRLLTDPLVFNSGARRVGPMQARYNQHCIMMTRTQILEKYIDFSPADFKYDFYISSSFKRSTQVEGKMIFKTHNRSRVFIPVEVVRATYGGGSSRHYETLPDISQFVGELHTQKMTIKANVMEADVVITINHMRPKRDVLGRAEYYTQLTHTFVRNTGLAVNWPEAMWNESMESEDLMIEAVTRLLFHFLKDSKATNKLERVTKITELLKEMTIYELGNPGKTQPDARNSEIDRALAEIAREEKLRARDPLQMEYPAFPERA